MVLGSISGVEGLSLIGWLIVVVCLVAAAYCAFKSAFLPAVGLLVVAIFAAVLLL